MTKHLTPVEFSEYVMNLKFEEFEDILAFVKSYYTAYKETPETEIESKNDAWIKYAILASHFCMTFIYYAEMNVALMKEFEEKINGVPNY